MTKASRVTFWLAAMTLAACSKSTSEPPAPSSSGAASASGASAAKAPPAASIAAPSGAAPSGAATFAGTYVAKQGPVEPPAAAKEKTWTDDPGTEAVGKGSMELSIDGGDANGPPRKVVGESKGALGVLAIVGTFDGKEVRANIMPKQANIPGAMTGFMTLTADGSSLKGTMRVSNGNARIVREAAVELARK
jgi:hypothetical protein